MRVSNSPREYEIAIHCICGNRYFGGEGPSCKCPHCGHVWVLFPPVPNTPEEIRASEQRLMKAGQEAFEKAQRLKNDSNSGTTA